jgi:hypothetical protein
MSNLKKNIAVGITPGYDILPNEFKEAVLATNLKKELGEKKITSQTILLVDDLDPFTKVHFKRLMKKNIVNEEYCKYLGFPLCKIPSPDKNYNLSEYFLKRYLANLEKLGIVFDKVVVSSKLRKTREFKVIFEKIVSKKEEIIRSVSYFFGKNYNDRFFKNYSNTQGYNYSNFPNEILFKFPWFLECLIRWEICKIDYEFFLERYLSKESGSYNISAFVSKNILKTKSAEPYKYEYIKFRKEIMFFFEVLPKNLFVKFIGEINRTSESFNLQELERILKDNRYSLNCERSYFEIYYFLSHFEIDEVINKDFLKKFSDNFMKTKISMSEVKGLSFSAIAYRNLYLEKEIGEYSLGEVYKFLKLVRLNQMSKYYTSLEDFKKFARIYLVDFKKDDFLKLNKIFYKNEKGISIVSYIYFKPRFKLYNEVIQQKI